MSRFFNMALGTVGLLVALGLVGYGFYWMLKRSYDPWKLFCKTAATVPFIIFCIAFAHKMGPFGPFLIVFMAVILSLVWTPHIADVFISPITNLFDGGNEPPEPKPLYSTAMGRRKFNRPLEAIIEIRKQLAKFPNDFEGVMLLAAVQAEDMKDLQSAEITLNNFCTQAKAPPNQIAGAWTQLADWHLKLGSDVDSAQRELEKIIARFPDTELSLHAEQRLAHLAVGTRKILLEAHDRPGMVVPEGVKNIGLRDSTKFLIPEEIDPSKLAAAHVKHLAAHPYDSEVREKLAMVYANDFQRLDLATLELEQLINEKRHSAKQIAGWLNLLANFQVKLGADVATVRATLEKIVEQFPDLAVADLTRRRLARLDSEFRGQKETPGVKLGVYEQNIGLKYGSPRKL